MRKPLLALTATGLLAVTACGSSSASSAASPASAGGASPTVGIGYFPSATVGAEVVVAGNPDLAGKIDGTIKLTPIDSGVAGLAELRGGAFPFVSGVGNPPVVGAIASNTRLKVVYAEDFDAAQLVVGPDIATIADLARKTVGDLQGSSEDFELRGWLSTQKLTDKVKVVGFPSQAAVAAAFQAGRIDAGYVEVAQALDLKQNAKGRQVVTAQEIAELGFPSLNVLAVTDQFAAAHRPVVQQVVCQVMRAQAKVAGPQGDTYITHGAKLVGAPPEQAIPATRALPLVTAEQQLSWFHPEGGTVAQGRIAQAYALTGQFLKDQGRVQTVQTVPTAEQISSHVDASYLEQARKDGCSS